MWIFFGIFIKSRTINPESRMYEKLVKQFEQLIKNQKEKETLKLNNQDDEIYKEDKKKSEKIKKIDRKIQLLNAPVARGGEIKAPGTIQKKCFKKK